MDINKFNDVVCLYKNTMLKNGSSYTTRIVTSWNVTPSCFVDMYQSREIGLLHLLDKIQFKAQSIAMLWTDGVL